MKIYLSERRILSTGNWASRLFVKRVPQEKKKGPFSWEPFSTILVYFIHNPMLQGDLRFFGCNIHFFVRTFSLSA